MTGSLQDLMRERADAQAPPVIDVDAIVSAGGRRVRLARAGAASLAVAAMAVGAFALPHLAGTAGTKGAEGVVAKQGQEVVAPFATRRPTYAVGDVIHYGDRQIEVGQTVGSFVQTDDGFVYATVDGVVHLADGSRTEVIGHTGEKGLYLKADDTGSLAAWVESPRDQAPELVVYDTAKRREVLRTDEGTRPGMTSTGDDRAAYVYAVDDGTVYWRNARGLMATDATDGSSTLLKADANAFEVAHVANGHFAHQVIDDQGSTTRLRVSTDLTQPAPPLPSGYSGSLSPSARYIVTDDSDTMAVYDTASREDVSPEVPGYAFVAGYAWLDDNTVTLIGIRRLGGARPVDILECTVPHGTCTVVAEDVAV